VTPPAGRADLAVIGAGIVGLAHALEAAKRGLSVVLFERDARAQGASVRNFGMVWPIGQSPGLVHQRALRTRQIWLKIAPAAKIWHAETGSLHLAYRPDENRVLQEFAGIAPDLGYDCHYLSAAQVLQRSQAVQPDNLLGGLWSPTEVCVDPRQAIARLPLYLAEQQGIECHFSTPVHAIDLPHIHTSHGIWHADRALVCSGTDFETLYPEIFAASGLTRCKLQMMRTKSQPESWSLGPMLAGGLTLRHYTSFAACPSLAQLKERVAAETPQYDRYGIHVMASQNGLGEIVIGDSHEYGDAVGPFDKPEIDRLILDYLHTFLAAPSLKISQRWHGIYAQNPAGPDFVADPATGVKVVNGVSGAGMSTSFGLAQETFDSWE
jgi:D-hydroxyproline dehydrogenase subunit beta